MTGQYVFLGSSSLDYSETQPNTCTPKKGSSPTLKDCATIFLFNQLGLGKIPTHILFYPENNLAKFGYILDTKVEKKRKKESFYVLGYLLELIIKKCDDLDLFLFKIWQNLGYFFFHEKSFCISQNHVFEVEIGKNLPVKETRV